MIYDRTNMVSALLCFKWSHIVNGNKKPGSISETANCRCIGWIHILSTQLNFHHPYTLILQSVLWKKQFTWLKHSSDDGHSKLSLQFRIPNSQIPETQVQATVATCSQYLSRCLYAWQTSVTTVCYHTSLHSTVKFHRDLSHFHTLLCPTIYTNRS